MFSRSLWRLVYVMYRRSCFSEKTGCACLLGGVISQQKQTPQLTASYQLYIVMRNDQLWPTRKVLLGMFESSYPRVISTCSYSCVAIFQYVPGWLELGIKKERRNMTPAPPTILFQRNLAWILPSCGVPDMGGRLRFKMRLLFVVFWYLAWRLRPLNYLQKTSHWLQWRMYCRLYSMIICISLYVNVFW